mmetsp:Transcript_93630/g.238419  ORF Transcript_93630/g.238419 Transcript_93630/m.238419 type:complete len:258 (-) Transcript_93630:1084-1857(-)
MRSPKVQAPRNRRRRGRRQRRRRPRHRRGADTGVGRWRGRRGGRGRGRRGDEERHRADLPHVALRRRVERPRQPRRPVPNTAHRIVAQAWARTRADALVHHLWARVLVVLVLGSHLLGLLAPCGGRPLLAFPNGTDIGTASGAVLGGIRPELSLNNAFLLLHLDVGTLLFLLLRAARVLGANAAAPSAGLPNLLLGVGCTAEVSDLLLQGLCQFLRVRDLLLEVFDLHIFASALGIQLLGPRLRLRRGPLSRLQLHL